MFYQCLEDEFCESFPLAVPEFLLPIKTLQLYGVHAEPQEAWHSIVEAYSTAELTKDSDKLIAIAGIAEAMQERLRDRYVAGLWEGNLLTELLWSAGAANKPRPNPCIAPTWSWLSTNSTVSASSRCSERNIRKRFATVVSTGVDLLDPSYATGNIHPGAVIQVRGRLKPAEWDVVAKYDADDFRRYQVTCNGFHKYRSSLNEGLQMSERGASLTHVDARPGLDLIFLDICLLPIAHFRGDNGSFGLIEGLVLTPRDAAAGIYERVAHFLANDKLAAYLFLEKLPGNRDQSALQRLPGRYGRVEGFAFEEAEKWTRIQERDIIIV